METVRRVAFLSFRRSAVELAYPASLDALVPQMLGASDVAAPGTDIVLRLGIEAEGGDRFTLSAQALGPPSRGLGLGDVLHAALTAVQRELAGKLTDHDLLLHAGSVARDGRAILIAGDGRSGKSSLCAWLVAKGYDYLSDEVTVLSPGGGIEGLGRPLMFREEAWPATAVMAWVSQVVMMADGRRLAQAPRPGASSRPAQCGLIVHTRYDAGATARLTTVTPARATALLMARNHSMDRTADHGLASLLALTETVPTIELSFGETDQLAALEPFISKVLAGMDRADLPAAIDAANVALALPAAPSAPASGFPAPTPRKGPVKLTVGMATYDDYDGVYFTIQSLRLYHPEVLDDIEIVVIDNQPDGKASPHLKNIENAVPNYRYVPFAERSGTACRQQIFEEASGRYVLGLDCHVLLVPGAVARVIAYFDAHPDSGDLLHGPLLYDDLKSLSSHWMPGWRGGMFGTWAHDVRADDIDGDPFEIPMQGMGLYACRREAWPGFNPAFRGFGGEEGYIHEKVRQAGHSVLCLPFLRWVHRFNRPTGTPFVNTWEDRIHNYYVGLTELGLPTGDMEAHFRELLGVEPADRIFRSVRGELGLAAL